MFKSYNPASHFWIVGGDEMQVYSSSLPGFVPATDAGYTAWLEEGGLPTRIASLDELRDVLLQQYPAGIVTTVTDQRAEIGAECEKAIAAIRAGYPESEVLSWPKQEAEARAFTVNANAATPLLDALATARGIAKAEIAARVIAKADAFAAISGQLIGKRQALEDALDALPADAAAEQIAAIVW